MLPLIGSDLRTELPASRMRLISRLAPFDLIWAGLSPVLAFLVRDSGIKSPEVVITYSCVALAISLLVFQWYRISASISQFFSIHDAFTIVKACLITVALTTVILFVFTRLDYAPRSIPVIHFFVLGSGLIAVRSWSRIKTTWPLPQFNQTRADDLDFIIVVGATRLAWFFSKMVEELSSHERRIVAIVDESPKLVGRILNGSPVVGLPNNLAKIIDEYGVHGVVIKKVVVAAHPRNLSVDTRNEIISVSQARNISVEWLHKLFPVSEPIAFDVAKTPHPRQSAIWAKRPYWKVKRALDFTMAAVMLIALAPLTLLVGMLVAIDVGFPVIFWQQRIGYLGRPLRVYKFRTMRSTFDRDGRPVPDSERLSSMGQLLRASRLDEIPQLLNVLTGGMSLVGPRPLLPIDQPANAQVRLQIRPGLTGLAQISGGTSLSTEEKDALDESYIRQHASFLMDLKILIRTAWVLIHGNSRNNSAISAALAARRANSQQNMVDSGTSASAF